MKVKVELDTMSDVTEFVSIVSTVSAPVHLVSDHFCVSGKSLLGALYTMEWSEVWCECDIDIYSKIAKFVV
jgi:hypothetical protein